MSSVDDPAPRSSPQLASTLQSLLETNQYDQTELVLQRAQQNAQEEGDVTGSVLLSAAHQLCVSCRQLHHQVAFHEQAYQESVEQADALNRQLRLLLQDASHYLEESASGFDPPLTTSTQKIENRHSTDIFATSLWQRIQRFLRLLPTVQPQLEPKPEQTATTPKQIANQIERPLFPDPASITEDATLVHHAEPAKKHQFDHTVQDDKRDPLSLIIYCLGAFRVYYNANLIDAWSGLKGQLIFKYLITQRGRPVPKEVLMELMWPEVDRDAARRNLHQAIYTLRKALKKEGSGIRAIRFENACYIFDPDVEVWLDYEEFRQHVKAGRQLEQNNSIKQAMVEYGIADGLYQGDFLPEDIYEEWTRPLREQLRRDYIDTANRLSKQFFQQNEYSAAIAICQKLLAYDNCHEGAYRRLIRCHWAQNQRHLAVRQYHHCRETLMTELNISPSEETNALFQELTS